MFHSRSIVIVAVCAAALLSGCEDTHQFDDVRPYMQPGSGPQPVAAAPAEIEAERDPIKPTDGPDTSLDMPKDPLVADDPLAVDKSSLDSDVDQSTPIDTLAVAGVTMPTKHSHWLRGAISGATVEISINHVKIGDYTATIDKDVTMRCRNGYNTVTFTYTPFDRSAFADIDVLESEHNPPIAPLATFDSTVDAVPDTTDVGIDNTPKPVTKTFEFAAQ